MMMTHDQALIKWEMSSLLKFTWGQEIQGSTMKDRFSDAPSVPVGMDSVKFSALTGRGSVREFTSKPVDDDIIEFLCGVAFSAPTKSDLQQRDIVVVRDPVLLEGLKACCAVQKWIDNISLMLVFCGNHRRQRRVSEMHGLPFVNDHLDAFFNASVDAALALAYFVAAAETAGLGCCPISAIRNQPGRASELLNLPDLVFPVAGLALGWPAENHRSASGCRWPLRSIVIGLTIAVKPKRLLPMIMSELHANLLRPSVNLNGLVPLKIMFGPRTRHANMPAASVRASAPLFALKALICVKYYVAALATDIKALIRRPLQRSCRQIRASSI